MPPKRRSTLEAERLRLERLRKRAADREYRRKKYPACPQCGQHHEPKVHDRLTTELRPNSIEPESASADPASTSERDSGENPSTDSTTESTGEKTSEDSNSTQTED